MKLLTKLLIIGFSVLAFIGAILGWALSTEKRAYPIQGPYEQHG